MSVDCDATVPVPVKNTTASVLAREIVAVARIISDDGSARDPPMETSTTAGTTITLAARTVRNACGAYDVTVEARSVAGLAIVAVVGMDRVDPREIVAVARATRLERDVSVPALATISRALVGTVPIARTERLEPGASDEFAATRRDEATARPAGANTLMLLDVEMAPTERIQSRD